MSTWSTLSEELLTPTERKPYQGLFVGDYASHGAEFLLVMMTEKAPRRRTALLEPMADYEGRGGYLQAVLDALRDQRYIDDEDMLGMQERHEEERREMEREEAERESEEAELERKQGTRERQQDIEQGDGDEEMDGGLEARFAADAAGPSGSVRHADLRSSGGNTGMSDSSASKPGVNHLQAQHTVEPNVPDDDGLIHQGSIEAIKLTGDVNVPRGEHTFIADDIGPRGFVRIAHEEPFRGARVVKSRGHVAARGFREGESLKFLVYKTVVVSAG